MSLCLACECSHFTLALFLSAGDFLFENRHMFLKFSRQCSWLPSLTIFNIGKYVRIISWQSGWNDLLKTNLTGIPSSLVLPLFLLVIFFSLSSVALYSTIRTGGIPNTTVPWTKKFMLLLRWGEAMIRNSSVSTGLMIVIKVKHWQLWLQL